MPHMTSSRISSAPWRSQISRTGGNSPESAVTQPVVAPTIGLGDEGDNGIGAEALELGFEFVGQTGDESASDSSSA